VRDFYLHWGVSKGAAYGVSFNPGFFEALQVLIK